MPAVDPQQAAWLRSEELLAVASSAPAAAKWGAVALDTRITSAIALKVDADAEAVRQLAFVGAGPIAVDVLLVPGNQIELIGKVVTLTTDKGGYSAGVDVFVLTADEVDTPGFTKLLVLRRL